MIENPFLITLLVTGGLMAFSCQTAVCIYIEVQIKVSLINMTYGVI